MAMGANHSFELISIETYAPQFVGYKDGPYLVSKFIQKLIFMFCTSFVLRQCGSKHEYFLGMTYVSDKSYKIISYFFYNSRLIMKHMVTHAPFQSRNKNRGKKYTCYYCSKNFSRYLLQYSFHFPIIFPISILFITCQQPILNYESLISNL